MLLESKTLCPVTYNMLNMQTAIITLTAQGAHWLAGKKWPDKTVNRYVRFVTLWRALVRPLDFLESRRVE
jgi:hypothetical protein